MKYLCNPVNINYRCQINGNGITEGECIKL